MAVQVVVLEREELFRDALAIALSCMDLSVSAHADGAAFLTALEESQPALALVDLTDLEAALAVLQLARERSPNTRIVCMAEAHQAPLEGLERFGVTAVVNRSSAPLATVVEALRAADGGVHLRRHNGHRPIAVSLGGGNALGAALGGQLAGQLNGVSLNGGLREAHLSPREHEVLRYVSAGYDNLKISVILGICERTVKAHVSALYRKLQMENRTQLALRGLEIGVSPPM